MLIAPWLSNCIPPRRIAHVPRTYDRDWYQARHLIENFFVRLKQYRAIATCYDRTARNSLGGTHLATAVAVAVVCPI